MVPGGRGWIDRLKVSKKIIIIKKNLNTQTAGKYVLAKRNVGHECIFALYLI